MSIYYFTHLFIFHILLYIHYYFIFHTLLIFILEKGIDLRQLYLILILQIEFSRSIQSNILTIWSVTIKTRPNSKSVDPPRTLAIIVRFKSKHVRNDFMRYIMLNLIHIETTLSIFLVRLEKFIYLIVTS